MRYVIESVLNELEVGRIIANLAGEGKISILEKAEPLEVLKEKLHKIQRSVEILAQAGIDKDVVACYIQTKTKLSRREIDAVLHKQEEFFAKLGVKLK